MIDLRLGDCVSVLKEIEDNSIDLTVTSPPYDNLRSYKGNNELWNEGVWSEVIAELYRVTKDGGVVVWVVGDATNDFCESGTSFRQALHAMDCGFNLLDTMIYAKKSYAPAYPTMRRYAQTFEYMFVFSKGKPNAFNPIKVPKSASSIEKRKVKSTYRQADGSTVARMVDKSNTHKSASNVWVLDTGFNKSTTYKDAFKHPATFPEQLAHDHILSWSNEGDTVLDCFMGSGTTGAMAVKLGRRFIGIELEREYYDISYKRINGIEESLQNGL